MTKNSSKIDTNAKFAEKYAIINSTEKQHNGPWEYEQPLKPRPKQFDVNDPDMMGG